MISPPETWNSTNWKSTAAIHKKIKWFEHIRPIKWRTTKGTGYPNVGVMWTATWFNVYCYKIISGTVAVHCNLKQETQLSPRYRAMRRVSWNLAGCHATVQKLLVRQVLNKSKLWSWRVKVGRCVINMCTQPWRVRVAFIVLKVS